MKKFHNILGGVGSNGVVGIIWYDAGVGCSRRHVIEVPQSGFV